MSVDIERDQSKMEDVQAGNPISSLGYRPLDDEAPNWLREISRFLSLRSQFVLSGNINDLVLMPVGDQASLLTLLSAVDTLLEVSGYNFLLCYDPLDHFVVVAPAHRMETAIAAVRDATGLNFDETGYAKVSLKRVLSDKVLQRFVTASGFRGGLVIENVARMSDEDSLSLFESAIILSQIAPRLEMRDGLARFNPIFWAVGDISKIPQWFIPNNDLIMNQVISIPNREIRSRLVSVLGPGIVGWNDLVEEKREQLVNDFSRATDGFTISAIVSITTLARDQGHKFENILDAVGLYEAGVTENLREDSSIHEYIDSRSRTQERDSQAS